MATAVSSAIAAGWATHTWPDFCILPVLRNDAVFIFALALIAASVAMWLIGAATVMKAYNRDQLVTSGPYSLVRHPLYSGWIVMILPAIALLAGSWPMLLAPLVAYTAFKLLIRREDEYLERRYGRSYLEYRGRVNELVPIPRFWDRRHY